MRALVIVAVGCAVLWALGGCASEFGTPLVELRSIEPTVLYMGDRLELVGSSFPPGRPATVTLDGQLFSAGAPSRAIRLGLPAVAGDGERVEVVLSSRFEEVFCGVGASLRHASFRGDVAIQFEAASDLAPPVSSVLHRVHLELFPLATSRKSLEEESSKGHELARFLGLVELSAVAEGGPRGLRIERVEPSGQASRLGLRAGDVIVEANQVAVFSERDLLLEEHEATVDLVAQRPFSPEPISVSLHAGAFEGRKRRAFGAASLVVLSAAFCTWFIFSPLSHMVGWLGRKRRGRQSSRNFGSAQPRAALGWLSRREVCVVGLGSSLAAWLSGAGLPNLERWLLSGVLLIWLAGALAALIDGGFAVRGISEKPLWSLRKALVRAAQQISLTAPGLVAFLLVVWHDLSSSSAAWPSKLSGVARPGGASHLLPLAVVLGFSLWVVPRRAQEPGLADPENDGRNWTAYALVELGTLPLLSCAAAAVLAGGKAIWPTFETPLTSRLSWPLYALGLALVWQVGRRWLWSRAPVSISLSRFSPLVARWSSRALLVLLGYAFIVDRLRDQPLGRWLVEQEQHVVAVLAAQTALALFWVVWERTRQKRAPSVRISELNPWF